MKKLLLGFTFLLLSVFGFSQIQEILTYPVDNATGFAVYGVTGGGYVAGTNDGTLEVGQWFEVDKARVLGVHVWIGAKEIVGAADSFSVRLYNAPATPTDSTPTGAFIDELRFSTADVDTVSILPNPLSNLQFFDLPLDVEVSGGFVIAFEVDRANADDTLGFVTSVSGDGMLYGRSMSKLSGSGWNSMQNIWSFGPSDPADFDIVILPVVEHLPSVNIASSKPDGCDGDIVDLTATISGTTGNYTLSWALVGGGTTGIASPTAASTPYLVGTSDVSIVATAYSTADTLYDTIFIRSNAVNVNLPATASFDCGLDTVLLASTTGNANGIQYAWTGPNGSATGPSYTVNSPGQVVVTATNASGCTSTDNTTVSLTGITQVLNFTYTNIEPGAIVPSCYGSGQTIRFENTSSELTGWTFKWNVGGSTSTLATFETSLDTVGSVEVVLEATEDGSIPVCKISLKQVITIENSVCGVGINESYLNQLIDVYPNPNDGVFTINFRDLMNEDVNIDIYNLQGKRVFTNNLSVTGNNIESVDLSNNTNGIYLVRIQVGNEVLSKTIAISK